MFQEIAEHANAIFRFAGGSEGHSAPQIAYESTIVKIGAG
jgi:hypothetical protein